MQRRLFGLQTVSNETSEEIDDKVEWAAMSGMLNLRDVLELIVDGLHDGPLAEQNNIVVQEQATLHIATGESHHLYLALMQQLFDQFLTDIAFVAKEFAEEPLSQARHRLTIIKIAWCELASQ